MGAVEEAQIRAAAAEAPRVAPDDRVPLETHGIVRALARTLGMVADDLTGLADDLDPRDDVDLTLLHHALGLVTGTIGVLDAIAPERANGLLITPEATGG